MPQKMFWACRAEKNFGDLIGPYIFEAAVGHPPQYELVGKGHEGTVLFTVGSIMHHISAPDVAVVWGSGVIFSDTKFARPAKIHAVRGPRTRARVRDLGYECPAVFGDPALLMPKIYMPSRSLDRYLLGVIPHMIHLEAARAAFNDPEVLIIDLCLPVESVIDQILSCDSIASSSLHGIIVAHAYGIPAIPLAFERPIKGDGVKFADYYESVELQMPTAIPVGSEQSAIGALAVRSRSSAMPDVQPIMDKLLQSRPF